MSQRILINPVTRIEGHAKISIYVTTWGEVSSAQFHVVEFRAASRSFAKAAPSTRCPV